MYPGTIPGCFGHTRVCTRVPNLTILVVLGYVPVYHTRMFCSYSGIPGYHIWIFWSYSSMYPGVIPLEYIYPTTVDTSLYSFPCLASATYCRSKLRKRRTQWRGKKRPRTPSALNSTKRPKRQKRTFPNPLNTNLETSEQAKRSQNTPITTFSSQNRHHTRPTSISHDGSSRSSSRSSSSSSRDRQKHTAKQLSGKSSNAQHNTLRLEPNSRAYKTTNQPHQPQKKQTRTLNGVYHCYGEA